MITFNYTGVVQTELGRHMGSLFTSLMNTVGNLIAKTPEMGAQTTIYCATEESIVKHSGCYFRLIKFKFILGLSLVNLFVFTAIVLLKNQLEQPRIWKMPNDCGK